jgi:hypothetical protein
MTAKMQPLAIDNPSHQAATNITCLLPRTAPVANHHLPYIHPFAQPSWRPVMDYTAASLLLCNVHRNTFSVLLPQISAQLGLSPSAAGAVQAGNLLAYLLGQLPSGRLADTLSGTR